MRFKFAVPFMFLLSSSLFSEPVEIMYYKFFGDYLVENPYQIDIDVENLSLAQIKEILSKKRKGSQPINADLAIIGYGPDALPTEFFAASNDVNYPIPLKPALTNRPARLAGSKWYIYFVDAYSSSTVRARRDHHWASSHRWLALVGLQDLQYIDE